MLGKTVIINAPSYFRAIFRAMSVFMPKSALEKVLVANREIHATHSLSLPLRNGPTSAPSNCTNLKHYSPPPLPKNATGST
jgi:hypothetical protein